MEDHLQNESLVSQPGYVPIEDGRIYTRPDDTKDAEKTRFLTFAGNTVTPEAMRQYPWLKAGGIQVHNHCLRFVRYFLRQGRLTPLMEDQHDPVAPETVDPQDKSWYKIMPPQGYVAPSIVPGIPGALAPPLVSKRILPGDQVEMILQGENLRYTRPRGIVEIKALKGYDYKPENLGNGLFLDKEIWRIQKAIFPDYPILPVLIYDIRRTLDAAWENTALRDIVEAFQESSQQFESYALTTVEQAHLNMNQVASSVGYAMPYTETDLVLLAQLGMKRKDKEFQQMAQMTGENQTTVIHQSSQTADDLLAMLADATQEERTVILDMMKRKRQVPVVATEEEVDLPSVNEPTAEPVAEVAIDAETMQMSRPQESTEPFNAVLKPEDFDLNGARPAAVHWKVWQKWQKEAGIEPKE